MLLFAILAASPVVVTPVPPVPPSSPAALLQAGGPMSWGLVAGLVAGVAAVALFVRQVRAERERAARAERRARLLLHLLERDRRRVAQALHDGPVQDLLALDMAANVTAYVSGEVQAPDDLAEVVRELRAVSEALRPPTLDTFGLAAAVDAHADRFRSRHPGIEVALDLDPVDLGPHVRLALFRVVQEALDNAAAHGPPRRVDVRLASTDDGAVLTVVDDGGGYAVPADVTEFALSGRYGVIEMVAHAEAVGARLHLESTPGETAVRVVAPRAAPDLS